MSRKSAISKLGAALAAASGLDEAAECGPMAALLVRLAREHRHRLCDTAGSAKQRRGVAIDTEKLEAEMRFLVAYLGPPFCLRGVAFAPPKDSGATVWVCVAECPTDQSGHWHAVFD